MYTLIKIKVNIEVKYIYTFKVRKPIMMEEKRNVYSEEWVSVISIFNEFHKQFVTYKDYWHLVMYGMNTLRVLEALKKCQHLCLKCLSCHTSDDTL